MSHAWGWVSDEELSDGEQASTEPAVIDDPEVWMDYWSEELVTLWHSLKDQAASLGASILDECDFPRFAQFCWQHSSGRPPAC